MMKMSREGGQLKKFLTSWLSWEERGSCRIIAEFRVPNTTTLHTFVLST